MTAKADLANINNQSTFGTWRDRTNEIITVCKKTATLGDAETNNGNFVLDGNFTLGASNTITANNIATTGASSVLNVASDSSFEGVLSVNQRTGSGTNESKVRFTSGQSDTETWSIHTSSTPTTADHKNIRITKGNVSLNIDGDTGSMTTQGSTAISIDSGMLAGGINNVPVGVSSASTGAFTQLDVSGSSGAIGNVENTNIGSSTPGTGRFTTLIASGGGASAINDVPIGTTTPESGAFTTLTASGNTTVGTADVNADLTVHGTITGALTGVASSTDSLTDTALDAVLNVIYPVGSIHLNHTGVNPGLPRSQGGFGIPNSEWEIYSVGRTLTGVNARSSADTGIDYFLETHVPTEGTAPHAYPDGPAAYQHFEVNDSNQSPSLADQTSYGRSGWEDGVSGRFYVTLYCPQNAPFAVGEHIKLFDVRYKNTQTPCYFSYQNMGTGATYSSTKDLEIIRLTRVVASDGRYYARITCLLEYTGVKSSANRASGEFQPSTSDLELEFSPSIPNAALTNAQKQVGIQIRSTYHQAGGATTNNSNHTPMYGADNQGENAQKGYWKSASNGGGSGNMWASHNSTGGFKKLSHRQINHIHSTGTFNLVYNDDWWPVTLYSEAEDFQQLTTSTARNMAHPFRSETLNGGLDYDKISQKGYAANLNDITGPFISQREKEFEYEWARDAFQGFQKDKIPGIRVKHSRWIPGEGNGSFESIGFAGSKIGQTKGNYVYRLGFYNRDTAGSIVGYGGTDDGSLPGNMATIIEENNSSYGANRQVYRGDNGFNPNIVEAQKKTSTYTLGLWSKHQMSKDRDALCVKDHYQNVYCWRRVA